MGWWKQKYSAERLGSFAFYLTFTKQRWGMLGGAEAAAAF